MNDQGVARLLAELPGKDRTCARLGCGFPAQVRVVVYADDQQIISGIAETRWETPDA